MDSEAEMSANLETEQIGWKDLPNELLFRITVFLDVKEFLDFMLVSSPPLLRGSLQAPS